MQLKTFNSDIQKDPAYSPLDVVNTRLKGATRIQESSESGSAAHPGKLNSHPQALIWTSSGISCLIFSEAANNNSIFLDFVKKQKN